MSIRRALRMGNDYIRHIFDTTLDYARSNPVATWRGCRR
jgi:hypothetical protein